MADLDIDHEEKLQRNAKRNVDSTPVDLELYAIVKGSTRSGDRMIYLAQPIGTVMRYGERFIKFRLHGKSMKEAQLVRYQNLSPAAKILYDTAPESVRTIKPRKQRKSKEENLRDKKVLPSVEQSSEIGQNSEP